MFRFSIRELMLATLVVAVATCWWLSYRREKALQIEAAEIKAKARLTEDVLVYMGYTINGDGREMRFDNKEMHIRSSPETVYLDIDDGKTKQRGRFRKDSTGARKRSIR